MNDKTYVGYAAFKDGTGELIIEYQRKKVLLNLTPDQIDDLNSINFPMCVHVESEAITNESN